MLPNRNEESVVVDVKLDHRLLDDLRTLLCLSEGGIFPLGGGVVKLAAITAIQLELCAGIQNVPQHALKADDMADLLSSTIQYVSDRIMDISQRNMANGN